MHPCNVTLHGFSYSACLPWVQKKVQYETILKTEMQHQQSWLK